MEYNLNEKSFGWFVKSFEGNNLDYDFVDFFVKIEVNFLGQYRHPFL
jgi:hypothetical protein